MRRRATLLFGAFLAPAFVASVASAFAGCGNTAEVGFSPDATAADVFVPPGPEAGPVHDAGVVEAGPSTVLGNCSAVDSPACDVVLNNCPASEAGVPGECLPGTGDASAFCTFERPSQHLPAGHTCCPTTSEADEPCLSGSQCVGDLCTDGGTATARCSPRCCDDSTCGSSPEGIAGHCSLDLVNTEGDSLYNVCTYQRPCKPFHIQPCPDGEVCTIEDHLGTSSCIDLFLPDGGDGSEGSGCGASNSCAESLACLSLGDDDDDDDDGGSVDAGDDDGGDDSDDDFACFYECIVTGFSTPFDASPNAPPGYGGCPEGEVCITLDSTDSPPWLGFCGSP